MVSAVQDVYGRPLGYVDEEQPWADPAVAERAGFEHAIDQNPLEGSTHQIYADWLDDHGEHDEAAFRRSLGEWMQKKGTSIYHPDAQALGGWKHFPWKSTREMPFDLNEGDLRSPNTGIVHHPELEVHLPVDLSDALRRSDDMGGGYVWHTYRGMEEAFRRAFMANLERQRNPPKPTQAARYAQESTRQRLTTGEVVAAEPLGSNFGETANVVAKVQLDDGIQAVFKPLAGEAEGRRDGVPDDTLYRREAAASLVADLLGFSDLVPKTVIKKVNGEVGSAQQFISGAVEASEAPPDYIFDGADAARAAAFDYIIGHNDRHRGNWLLKDGKLVLIDNGFSFPVSYSEKDFKNREFLDHAAKHNLPLPDLRPLRSEWSEVEHTLRGVGIEPRAIDLTHKRFNEITSGMYHTVGDLPAFFGSRGGRLRDYWAIPRQNTSHGSPQDTTGRSLGYFRPANLERQRQNPTQNAQGIDGQPIEYDDLEDPQERVSTPPQDVNGQNLPTPSTNTRPAPVDSFAEKARSKVKGIAANNPDYHNFAFEVGNLVNTMGPEDQQKFFQMHGVDPNAASAMNDLAGAAWHANAQTGAPAEPASIHVWRRYIENLQHNQAAGMMQQNGIDPGGMTDGPYIELANVLRQRELRANPPRITAEDIPVFENPHFQEPTRNALTVGDVTGERPVKSSGGNNINVTKKITLNNGLSAVFKPKHGEAVGWREGIPDETLYRREAAASIVADILGFGDMVPKTTVREVNGQIGSAQQFRPGEEGGKMGARMFDGDKDAARAAVFDYIIGHADRHAANWMLRQTPEDMGFNKLSLIDNGYSFPVTHVERDFNNRMFFDHAARQNLPLPDLRSLRGKWPEVEKAMRDMGLEQAAVDTARHRFDTITSGRYRYIGDLPAFFGDPSKTLREYANRARVR